MEFRDVVWVDKEMLLKFSKEQEHILLQASREALDYHKRLLCTFHFADNSVDVGREDFLRLLIELVNIDFDDH